MAVIEARDTDFWSHNVRAGSNKKYLNFEYNIYKVELASFSDTFCMVLIERKESGMTQRVLTCITEIMPLPLIMMEKVW